MPSVIGSSSGSSAKLAINANSLTSFNASNQAAQTIWWIAIGKQQWGSLSNWSTGANSYTYPIAFSERTYSLAYSITTVRESAVAIYNATKTEFTYSTNAASTSVGISVIFLGKQQWGYVVGGINTFTVTFLITYISAFGATASGAAETPTAANTEVSELTNTGFTLRRSSSSNPVYWIAWGVQQWGYLSFSAVVTAQKVITYPIALSEIALPVAIAIAESYGNDAGLAINNDCMGNHYSSCEFNVISYGTQRCVGIIFVVIGKQQWGSNFSTVTAETLVDYPIAVSQVLTILCAADQTDIRDAEYAAPGTVTDTNFIAVTFALFGSTHAQPYPYYWIMVGIVQQWGLLPVLTTLFNFPIQVEVFLGAHVTYHGRGDYGEPHAYYLGYSEYSNTHITLPAAGNDDETRFISIFGLIQQWGVLITSANAITFPVTFTSIEYMFLSKIYGPASGGSDLVAYNYFQRLLTGVTYDYSYTRNWIAIGQ